MSGNRTSTQPARTLSEAVLGPHDVLRERMAQAREAVAVPEDPRRHIALGDTFLATLSIHLAAVEVVVCPSVRHRLPDGRDLAGEQVHLARQLERAMRDLEGSLYGDVFVVETSRAALWEEMERLVGEHVESERKLIGMLTEVLGAEEERQLAESFVTTVEHAPTRPHPYSPHSAILGRFSNRLWSLADRAMDTMDNRIVPRKPATHHAPAGSRWGQYLLGQPTFDEEPLPKAD